MKTDLDDYDFDEKLGINSGATGEPCAQIVVLITGASQSVNVARLEISIVFEYIPVDSMYWYANIS